MDVRKSNRVDERSIGWVQRVPPVVRVYDVICNSLFYKIPACCFADHDMLFIRLNCAADLNPCADQIYQYARACINLKSHLEEAVEFLHLVNISATLFHFNSHHY